MGSYRYEVIDFQRVVVEHAITVDIVRGEVYSVTIEADDISRIKVEKEADTLKIGRRGFSLMALLHPHPQVNITMPELKEVTLTGACRVRMRGFNTTGELALKITGASHLEMNQVTAGGIRVDASGASNVSGEVTAGGRSRFDVSGASRVELAGTGNDAVMKIAGASTARLAGLTFNNMTADISGASSAYLKINGHLDLDLSGASRLEYAGAPILGKVKISGAATLRQR